MNKTLNEKIPKKKGNRTLVIGAVVIILLAGVAYAILSGGSTDSSKSTKTPAGAPAATAVQTSSADLSALSLPDNFKSLSDGLKLIPPGITWVYFANLKQGTGIEQNVYLI